MRKFAKPLQLFPFRLQEFEAFSEKNVGPNGCLGHTMDTSFHNKSREREFCIDNLLVRVHFIIVMMRWTGLAPSVFEFPFPGSLTSTFLNQTKCWAQDYREQVLTGIGSIA